MRISGALTGCAVCALVLGRLATAGAQTAGRAHTDPTKDGGLQSTPGIGQTLYVDTEINLKLTGDTFSAKV